MQTHTTHTHTHTHTRTIGGNVSKSTFAAMMPWPCKRWSCLLRTIALVGRPKPFLRRHLCTRNTHAYIHKCIHILHTHTTQAITNNHTIKQSKKPTNQQCGEEEEKFFDCAKSPHTQKRYFFGRFIRSRSSSMTRMSYLFFFALLWLLMASSTSASSSSSLALPPPGQSTGMTTMK